MITLKAPCARAAKLVGITSLLLGCAGEISETPDDVTSGDNSRGGRGGAAGAGGRAGSGGRGGSAGRESDGGSAGSATADAGSEGGAAGGSMTETPAAPQLPPDCPTINPIPVAGQEIVIQSMNFNNSEVVLRNVSDHEVTILGQRTGWQWCNFPAYWAINEASDIVLSPDETFAFTAIYNTTGPREFDPEGGEMGIYTTTGSFTTADLMRAFVSWGNVIPQREATASSAGYWAYGDRIQGTEEASGFVIVGQSNRADGYQAVRAACLAAPPNQAP
jgi:hypothetical protein